MNGPLRKIEEDELRSIGVKSPIAKRIKYLTDRTI